MAAYDQQRYIIADASLTAGHAFVVGPSGDDHPRALLEDVVLVNPGTVDLRVGHSLTGVLGTRYQTLIGGAALPIAGPCDNVIVYNPEAATAGAWDLGGVSCGRNSYGWNANAGISAGAYRGAVDQPFASTRYRVVRLSGVAGADTDLDTYFASPIVVTGVKWYSVSLATGATLTGDVRVAGGSLLSAVRDLETLVTRTLTSSTLTATTALLTVAAGAPVTLRYSSSAGGDTVGDLLCEIAYRVG